MITPAELGYRMPAEWAPHRATWLVWPHRRSDWPGKFSPIRWVYTEIIRQLAQGEQVELIVSDATAQAQATKCLRAAGVDLARVTFVELATNRGWTRDSGPTFVRNATGTVALVDWHFNAWAKYPDWPLDDALPAHIAQRDQRQAWQPTANGRRIVLEGGSIDVNGAGWLLTTEECLLSDVQARNPGLSRAELEACLSAHLGLTDIIWLQRGIVGDDTHGHVDDLTRFVAERTVVTVVEDNPTDENYTPLQENLDILRGWRSASGAKLEVIPLPMPSPVVFAGQRLPASYANFYIANGVVIVPTFNDPRDRLALGILAELFPERRVVGIHAGDLVWGLGTLHCMTQQEPTGTG